MWFVNAAFLFLEHHKFSVRQKLLSYWRGDLTAVSGPQRRCKTVDQTGPGDPQTCPPYQERHTLVAMGTRSEGRRVVGGTGGVSSNLHLVLVTTRAQLLK